MHAIDYTRMTADQKLEKLRGLSDSIRRAREALKEGSTREKALALQQMENQRAHLHSLLPPLRTVE